ncbi:VWA domain-containing protein [Paraburkholderia phymatum]|uniref:Magnesium chelatase subunit ChlD n=1 Tax=Paraburkholderia phymatum (strain DSM 17167 / CIP 108236 / LMG 21445 / STM815) TaxID=391038 RepID=B2JRJ1_PARP8|nr:VWA domain-containing protein [Paraburkholderia phymatum]ACC72318.1 magnesium chelatase subunit ChlD [Paraburkholderia phymatum STM815]
MRSGFRWRQGAGDVSRVGLAGARIAWPRTLAAKRNEQLTTDHLRFKHEEAHSGVLHCFLLDCSASMMAGQRLALAKGILVALFDQARMTRDQVALICFGGSEADVRFGPAVPRWWNERWLSPIGGGGGTPLLLGIETAASLLERAARKRPTQQRWLWVFSDGRSSGSPVRPRVADEVVFVDFEDSPSRLGRCSRMAGLWRAQCISSDELICARSR